jgi:hypothetical protein
MFKIFKMTGVAMETTCVGRKQKYEFSISKIVGSFAMKLYRNDNPHGPMCIRCLEIPKCLPLPWYFSWKMVGPFAIKLHRNDNLYDYIL